jgi:hypothetical protein
MYPAVNASVGDVVGDLINDSLVVAFFNKYKYNFWRPETAIHAGDMDGNPKPRPIRTSFHSSRPHPVRKCSSGYRHHESRMMSFVS